MIKLIKLFESFDKVSDLLSDPRNNEKTIWQLLDDFKAKGGEILGNGKFATVLFRPSWKYVVKIFSDDVPYLKFVRFVLKNPRPSFPVFYDKPRRIIPNYKRHKSNTYLYVVKTEKLLPITTREYGDIIFYTSYDTEHSGEMASDGNQTWVFIYNKMKKLEQEKPSFPQFKKDYNFMLDSAHDIGSPDIHSKNIMKRNDGTLVLADPFWVGETPYQTHDRLLKAEIGYDEDEYRDTEQDMIKGGEKFKQPKLPKPVKSEPKSSNDDVPF